MGFNPIIADDEEREAIRTLCSKLVDALPGLAGMPPPIDVPSHDFGILLAGLAAAYASLAKIAGLDAETTAAYAGIWHSKTNPVVQDYLVH